MYIFQKYVYVGMYQSMYKKLCIIGIYQGVKKN